MRIISDNGAICFISSGMSITRKQYLCFFVQDFGQSLVSLAVEFDFIWSNNVFKPPMDAESASFDH